MGGLSEILWQEQSSLPLLIWLQLIPLIGAAVVFAFKERSTAVIAGKSFGLRLPGVEIAPDLGELHCKRVLTELALHGKSREGA